MDSTALVISLLVPSLSPSPHLQSLPSFLFPPSIFAVTLSPPFHLMCFMVYPLSQFSSFPLIFSHFLFSISLSFTHLSSISLLQQSFLPFLFHLHWSLFPHLPPFPFHSIIIPSFFTPFTFTLNNNYLTTLPSGIFSDQHSLTSLFISSSFHPHKPSRHYPISLHSNSLSSLPSGVFEGLDNLPYLSFHFSLLLSLIFIFICS